MCALLVRGRRPVCSMKWSNSRLGAKRTVIRRSGDRTKPIETERGSVSGRLTSGMLR